MANKRIALITDSTCDIPADWRKMYDIRIVPLTLVWGQEQYLDGVDMQPAEFYERLATDPVTPKTSQPAPSQFLSAFEAAREDGYEEAIVFTISSNMSGTIVSARQAVEFSPIPVQVVDSLENSMGLGWQVITAARTRENGGDSPAMIAAAQKARTTMKYGILLDTMNYLVSGGRIGGAVRFLNSVLQIKPEIWLNGETGKVEAGLPARSREKGIENLYRNFFRKMDVTKPLHLTVLHNAALEEARTMMERVIKDFHPVEIFIQMCSPILGAHTGPRAIALCGYYEV